MKHLVHSPTWKQVHFDLTGPEDLGDPSLLLDNVVGLIGWPGDTTSEWHDAWVVATPTANCHEMTEPKRVSGQCCTPTTSGARSKSRATGTMAPRNLGPHHLMPDPITQPK